jgi:hypothetical protein
MMVTDLSTMLGYRSTPSTAQHALINGVLRSARRREVGVDAAEAHHCSTDSIRGPQVGSLPGNPSRDQRRECRDRHQNVPPLHVEDVVPPVGCGADREESDANAGEDCGRREDPAPYLHHACLQYASRRAWWAPERWLSVAKAHPRSCPSCHRPGSCPCRKVASPESRRHLERVVQE